MIYRYISVVFKSLKINNRAYNSITGQRETFPSLPGEPRRLVSVPPCRERSFSGEARGPGGDPAPLPCPSPAPAGTPECRRRSWCRCRCHWIKNSIFPPPALPRARLPPPPCPGPGCPPPPSPAQSGSAGRAGGRERGREGSREGREGREGGCSGPRSSAAAMRRWPPGTWASCSSPTCPRSGCPSQGTGSSRRNVPSPTTRPWVQRSTPGCLRAPARRGPFPSPPQPLAPCPGRCLPSGCRAGPSPSSTCRGPSPAAAAGPGSRRSRASPPARPSCVCLFVFLLRGALKWLLGHGDFVVLGNLPCLLCLSGSVCSTRSAAFAFERR